MERYKIVKAPFTQELSIHAFVKNATRYEASASTFCSDVRKNKDQDYKKVLKSVRLSCSR